MTLWALVRRACRAIIAPMHREREQQHAELVSIISESKDTNHAGRSVVQKVKQERDQHFIEHEWTRERSRQHG